jgi:hypothetical protein
MNLYTDALLLLFVANCCNCRMFGFQASASGQKRLHSQLRGHIVWSVDG